MKPYKERLPLIDAAIDELKEWPLSKPHSLVRVKHNGSWVYAFTDDRITMGSYAGTRDELNERKRERQNKPKWVSAPKWANWLAQSNNGHWYWYRQIEKPVMGGLCYLSTDEVSQDVCGEVIGSWQDTLEQRPETKNKEQSMKYEYGVEYETNGEKPDLPDDVLVTPMDVVSKTFCCRQPVKVWRWEYFEKFRIVDERYKKEQDMNDCYSKGELPPAGTECEVEVDGKWYSAFIVGLNKDGGIVFSADDRPTGCQYDCYSNTKGMAFKKFRPLQTEMDKLQSDILSRWNDKGVDCPIKEWELAKHLHALGYRKIKPMSEDEFIAECLKFMNLQILNHDERNSLCEMARFIHRAGCVFLDKGE